MAVRLLHFLVIFYFDVVFIFEVIYILEFWWDWANVNIGDVVSRVKDVTDIWKILILWITKFQRYF